MVIIAKFILWLGGWKFVGDNPEVKKAIIISAPHTSNWDFFWGKWVFVSRRIPTYILIKKEFFFFPVGILLRALNCIPVDRGKKDSQLVDRLSEEFKNREAMYLCITPEGSRKKRKKWKKGFLVIAKATNVPVYLGSIDYKTRICSLNELFHPTDNVEADMKYIMSTYKNVHAKYPENFSCGDD
ncbi:acyltransferase [Bacteroidia bacterium]|nr:acyltransferase [Bacteroidia bacterium]